MKYFPLFRPHDPANSLAFPFCRDFCRDDPQSAVDAWNGNSLLGLHRQGPPLACGYVAFDADPDNFTPEKHGLSAGSAVLWFSKTPVVVISETHPWVHLNP